MSDLNTVNIIGRMTRDISESDFAYTLGGTARLTIGIAVNRSEKRGGEWGDKASFFDITVWGKTAEGLKPYLHKGRQVAVCGYLDQQRWEKDGRKFSKVVVVANSVQLLGGGNGTNGTADMQGSAQGYSDAGSGDDFPEDIPF